MGLGVGLILGLLNVFARDIGQIIPIALQFVFWFTPIVYMVEIIPESYRHLMNWNPVYLLIDNFHNIMVFGGGPDWEMLIKAGFFIAILLTFSFYVFRRASAEMVDML
jgi:lipopolysaccharide transport system permease protein